MRRGFGGWGQLMPKILRTSTKYVPQENPSPLPPSESTKVYTLYFSGRSPGEYTTRLTTVTVGAGSEPASRKRRHVPQEEESIEPTRVRPILMTAPPSHKQACWKCTQRESRSFS